MHPTLTAFKGQRGVSIASSVRERSGFLYMVSAYLVWGMFPAFFVLLSAVNPLESVPWRAIWSFVFSTVLVLATGRWRQLVGVLKNKRQFGFLALSGLLLLLNWQTFVYGAVSGHIIETSLGYFINPFLTIALGVIFLKERMRPIQWLAVSIAFLAVIELTVAYGQLPWIALVLALSFGLYGFVKSKAVEAVDPTVGMSVETLTMFPFALVQLVIFTLVATTTPAVFMGLSTNLLMMASAPLSILPLILFAAGAKRLPLIYIGFIQFMTPILSFLIGYVVMGEPMSAARWVGFIIVWLGVLLLIIDMAIRARRQRTLVKPEGIS